MLLLLLAVAVCLGGVTPLSEVSECYTVNGRDYRGSANHSGSEGPGCLYWNQTLLHRYNSQADPSGELGLGEHNHCRNPDLDFHPWCYVSETEEGVYWKYCDIPSCHMPGYLGCFQDSGSPPSLSGASGTSAKLSIQTCLRFCRSHRAQYAGLEAGYACFCGGEEDVGRLQEVSVSQCDQACFGKSGEVCGGDGKLSMYAAWVGACGGNLSASSGVIYSPDYPDEYGPGSDCSWEIRPPGCSGVELRVRLFQVEDPGDALEIRDGESGKLLAVIRGGQDPPAVLTFLSRHLTVTFTSDQEWSGAGYALTYAGLGKVPEIYSDAWSPAPPPQATTQDGEAEPSAPCWNAWLLLAVSVTLLLLASLLFLWRGARCHDGAQKGADAESSCCPALDRQTGDLTSLSESSTKSLL